MALPPTPLAPAPGMPPAGAGTDPTAPPMGDQGEGDSQGTVVATILKNSDGTFTMIQGDEPEAGEEGAPSQNFDSGPELMRALMKVLEGGQDDAIQKGFGEGFDGGSGASEQRPGLDMPPKG